MIPVSAIIVTRGDVDLTEILESLPAEWERVVWTNGDCCVVTPNRDAKVPSHVSSGIPDLSVYGRYAAIEHASHDLIFAVDDDVVISDPQAIVDAWHGSQAQCAEEQFDPRLLWHASPEEIIGIGSGKHVCSNMPAEFRHDFYQEHSLVGFGAAFHRDAPKQAFGRFNTSGPARVYEEWEPIFRRTCDVVFTTLTPRVLVDVPVRNLPWATGDDRMYRQREHQGERQRMLDLVLKVRDGG